MYGFLMQKDQRFRQKARATHLLDEVGDSNMSIPYASPAFDAVFPPCAKLRPFNGVELQPSAVCPKNFIIFDQTYDKSQVMYHPEMTRKLNSPALNAFASSFQNGHARDQEASSSLNEDSDEIDALLNFDEEEEEEEEEDDNDEYDAEEVSTARNSGNYGNHSPESSCSSYGYNSRKLNDGSGNASCNNGGKKRQKMKKMIKVLRRIVPGGEQMNTACILDEAVQYLKSLKVEAQKLGVGNFTSEA